MKFYTKFSPKESKGIDFIKPSMTEQHFKAECDINNIVATFQETGVLPQGNRQPLFGDFDLFPQDLASSMAQYDEAMERFMQLDSSLRKEFNNDPVQLLAFLQDEKNRDRAVELGLIEMPQPAVDVVSSERTNVEPSPKIEAET